MSDEQEQAKKYVEAELAGDERAMTLISQYVDKAGFPDSSYYDRFMDALDVEREMVRQKDRCTSCSMRPGKHETRDGRKLCAPCAIVLNFCEICGSTRMSGQSADDQLHYDELCFK